MKRAIPLLLSAALLLGALSACKKEDEISGLEPDLTAKQLAIAAYLASGYDQDADVEYLTAEEGGEDMLSAYLENAYQLEVPWEDAAVIRATGASAFEVAVLRAADEEAAVRAASGLMSYISARQGDFAGYAPDQADMVAQGSVMQRGPYAGLFICPDPDSADATFQAAVDGSSQLEPERSDHPPKLKAEAGIILDFLLGQCADVPDDVERLDGSDPERLVDHISSAYGLGKDRWEDAAIVRGTKDAAFEIAVLRVKDEDAAQAVMDILNSYLDEQEAAAGLSADQFELVYGASAFEVGMGSGETFVILPVCADPEGLLFNALTGALQPSTIGRAARHQDFISTEPGSDPGCPDRIKFVQPNKDDMSLYDTSAILAAWEEDDPSGLSDQDRDIYDQAERVLEQVLKTGMSDYEKEVAVYDWVVNNVDYDWTHQDRMMTTPRESFTPYGGLVDHKAVCLGYATTFQLLMDLAGVECITVAGAAFGSSEDHGWNMVRLNGQWYCVDVTWDANMREQIGLKGQRNWSYFNVTSDYMAGTDHQWDYANTPEATAEDRGQG